MDNPAMVPGETAQDRWVMRAQAILFEVAGELGTLLERCPDETLKAHDEWIESMILRLDRIAQERPGYQRMQPLSPTESEDRARE